MLYAVSSLFVIFQTVYPNNTNGMIFQTVYPNNTNGMPLKSYANSTIFLSTPLLEILNNLRADSNIQKSV
jgi:hypothetical protein